jgi:hypothetical protein
MSKNKRHKSERYVKLRYWLLDSPAWQSLPGNARALYIQMAQRYNGSNNGHIPFAVRDGVVLHVSHHTVSHLLTILQARGFIVCTRKGAFSLKTTKDASEWRLTEYNNDVIAEYATKEFMRWRPPEDDLNTLNQQPSHHRKSKTWGPQRDRVVAPARPCGGPSETVKRKNRQNGGPSETVKAKKAPSTVAPARHSIATRGKGPGPEAGKVAYAPVAKDPSRHSREAIMSLVAGVVAEQLDALDARCRKPKGEDDVFDCAP